MTRLFLVFVFSFFWVNSVTADLNRVVMLMSSTTSHINDDIAEILSGQYGETEVHSFEFDHCNSLQDVTNNSLNLMTDSDFGVFVWAPCPEVGFWISKFFKENDIAVPVIVLDEYTPDQPMQNVFTLVLPNIESTLIDKIQELIGTDLRVGFAGDCNVPTFSTSQELGPIWRCIDGSMESGNSSVIWAEAIGLTVRMILASHPNFAGGDANTPFGTLTDPWAVGELTIPSRVIFDVDHSTIPDNILREYHEDENLFDFFCPNCSASGFICGNSCPYSCNGNCTERSGRQCCKGDGMRVWRSSN